METRATARVACTIYDSQGQVRRGLLFMAELQADNVSIFFASILDIMTTMGNRALLAFSIDRKV